MRSNHSLYIYVNTMVILKVEEGGQLGCVYIYIYAYTRINIHIHMVYLYINIYRIYTVHIENRCSITKSSRSPNPPLFWVKDSQLRTPRNDGAVPKKSEPEHL